MAKKTAQRPSQADKPRHQCRQCRHSYDWHEKNWRGEPFMCRCPYHHEGRYTRLLSSPACEHFAMKEENNHVCR